MDNEAFNVPKDLEKFVIKKHGSFLIFVPSNTKTKFICE